MYFSSNLKLLRKRHNKTQDDLAGLLNMKRTTLSGYENNLAQPGIETLMVFSDYFGIAIDTLVRTNLSEIPESQLRQLERGYDVFIKGSNIRVLATTVDSENEENIELVSEKAKAGYSTGFADPEYIRILPTFQLPFLSRERKYRTFQISGDSMLPIPDGAYVTGQFVQDWTHIRNRQAYIILTFDDGIVFKVAENRIDDEGVLRLYSLNTLYEPYNIEVKEIREVWKFVNYISPQFPDPMSDKDSLARDVKGIKDDLAGIKQKLKL